MGQLSPDFDGETVIVTGAASGIGREIARRFGAAGATTIVADIEETPKDGDVPTDEKIEQEDGSAHFVQTDVTDVDQLSSLVEAAREFGGVDIMVNNAGIIIPGDFREVSPGDFDAILDVNVRGTFFGTQAAANDMIDRDDPGIILNTASISSNFAQFGQVQYDASKGAVQMITRGAALELAKSDIRVNAVAPGQIATEMTEGWSEEAKREAREGGFIKPVPLQRAGLPEDIASAYLYLASDDASYVTGEILHVDGGWQII